MVERILEAVVASDAIDTFETKAATVFATNHRFSRPARADLSLIMSSAPIKSYNLVTVLLTIDLECFERRVLLAVQTL